MSVEAMSHRARVAGGLCAVLLITMVLAPPSAHADDVAKGRALAERLCANCHMNPGQGEKTGADTVPGFVAVARRPGQTLDGIIAWLRSVPPMMPDHHLTQDEMQALAFYVLSLADDAAPRG